MTQEQKHWNTILSNDRKVWSVAKHRAADELLKITKDLTQLKSDLFNLFKKTGDQYYIALVKKIH